MSKAELLQGTHIKNLVGTPIYTLETAKRVGTVKGVLFDADQGQIVGFTLEEPGIISPERRILPFRDVKSVGRDAIMIQDTSVLLHEKDATDYTKFRKRPALITDKIVLTESGNKLGTISDVVVNPTTGQAISYEVSGGMARDIGSGRRYVDVPHTAVIGEDAVLVPDNTEVVLESQEPGGLAGAYRSARSRTGAFTREQEINLSRGKTAGRDVCDGNGDLIVAKGETITDDIIDRAVQEGKMHEVALAAGVGSAAAGYDRVLGDEARGRAGSFWAEARERASEAWSNLTESTRESADRAGRRRVISAQKEFLRGKVSSTTVTDDIGNVILREGEVITPLILDDLDRAGKMHEVKLNPEGLTSEESRTEGDNDIHVVVESAEQHKRH